MHDCIEKQFNFIFLLPGPCFPNINAPNKKEEFLQFMFKDIICNNLKSVYIYRDIYDRFFLSSIWLVNENYIFDYGLVIGNVRSLQEYIIYSQSYHIVMFRMRPNNEVVFDFLYDILGKVRDSGLARVQIIFAVKNWTHL